MVIIGKIIDEAPFLAHRVVMNVVKLLKNKFFILRRCWCSF